MDCFDIDAVADVAEAYANGGSQSPVEPRNAVSTFSGVALGITATTCGLSYTIQSLRQTPLGKAPLAVEVFRWSTLAGVGLTLPTFARMVLTGQAIHPSDTIGKLGVTSLATFLAAIGSAAVSGSVDEPGKWAHRIALGTTAVGLLISMMGVYKAS
jgi:hypothetical protein